MYVDPNFTSKKALKEAVAGMCVIRSREEFHSNGKPLFWSNEDGWVDRKSATLFSKKETEEFDLPLGDCVCVYPPEVRVFSPGPFPAPTDGECSVEGPHYPKPHTWGARVRIENGIVVKVLS